MSKIAGRTRSVIASEHRDAAVKQVDASEALEAADASLRQAQMQLERAKMAVDAAHEELYCCRRAARLAAERRAELANELQDWDAKQRKEQ